MKEKRESKQKKVRAVGVADAAPRPLPASVRPTARQQVWRWGDDNLFPYALALMSRRSTTHRRIINDKADYISGKGFVFDPGNAVLALLVERANGEGETLRQVINKLALDKALFGNAFLEVVTDPERSFAAFYHQDASRCRVGRAGKGIVMHHDWRNFDADSARRVPLYPDFAPGEDGCLHAMIHYKDYEPMYEHYGVPPYIAGMNVSAIAYKTDRWNMSRLDNSFQLSGVMLLDTAVDSEEEARQIVRLAEEKFAGRPGQVMFMVQSGAQSEHSRFIPIDSSNEGDWRQLHDQATSDIVVAHSWFRALSGLDYTSGFSAERILHEYEIALNTVILGEQAELMEPIREAITALTGAESQSLQIVNRPPTRNKPLYMKVWEARRADGLEYDTQDPLQQKFLSEITKYNIREIK
ncbi:MAG: phage portal protein [Rikenellaceae bacterium]|nr:phage portal protein [Rikenellaceae bacterium]